MDDPNSVTHQKFIQIHFISLIHLLAATSNNSSEFKKSELIKKGYLQEKFR